MSHIEQDRYLGNAIHQMYRKWTKFWIVFYLNTGQHFFLDVLLQSQQKKQRFFWKMVLGDFKRALHLKDQHVFIWQSLKILNVLDILDLKQIFWKIKVFLKKLEYHYLFKIENVVFPCKTALSGANIKQ